MSAYQSPPLAWMLIPREPELMLPVIHALRKYRSLPPWTRMPLNAPVTVMWRSLKCKIAQRWPVGDRWMPSPPVAASSRCWNSPCWHPSMVKAAPEVRVTEDLMDRPRMPPQGEKAAEVLPKDTTSPVATELMITLAPGPSPTSVMAGVMMWSDAERPYLPAGTMISPPPPEAAVIAA